MRLWHQDLLDTICKRHVLGLHREVCAMRGGEWNGDQGVVDYVYEYSRSYLVGYHLYMMTIGEIHHDINFNDKWKSPVYRGKSIPEDQKSIMYKAKCIDHYQLAIRGKIIYPEHDNEFLLSDIRDLINRSESDETSCDCPVIELRSLLEEYHE